MAKQADYQTPPLMLIMFTDDFKGVEYATPLQGPYEAANPIQVAMMKAQALGKGVIVQIAVCDLSMVYGDQPPEEETNGTTTEDQS